MPPQLTIRPSSPDDRDPVAALALGNAMFAEDEVGALLDAFDASLAGEADHRWLTGVDSDGEVVAAAYVAPEPFGDRVWNLYFIAVRPDRHRAGVGTRLIETVEEELRSLGRDRALILLVETSGTGKYATARAFYSARGYDEEARIRDFYGVDDDKVVFWKRLAG